MDDEPATSNETSNELHASEDNSKSTSYRETICCHFISTNSCRFAEDGIKMEY